METNKPVQEHAEGKIDRKEKKEKGPIGDFYIDGIKYTCWSETIWNKFDIEDDVKLSYVTKTSDYNGRTFTNRNISFMTFIGEPEPGFTKPMKNILAEEGVNTDKLRDHPIIINSENLKFKLGGLTYRIKSVEIELLEN
jgi:hypothetical protein